MPEKIQIVITPNDSMNDDGVTRHVYYSMVNESLDEVFRPSHGVDLLDNEQIRIDYLPTAAYSIWEAVEHTHPGQYEP